MSRNNSTMITPSREGGQHLKFEDRVCIKIYRKLKYTLRAIADVLDCSPSTIMYEIKRGTGERIGSRGRFPEYNPSRGQANYEVNRSRCHRKAKALNGNPFVDWVSEFSRLSEIEVYGVSIYFAQPYSSWERAHNERHNRILRRDIPKGVSIDLYSAEQILHFADEMNALPRKQLGYRTPEELFEKFLDKVYSLKNIQVA